MHENYQPSPYPARFMKKTDMSRKAGKDNIHHPPSPKAMAGQAEGTEENEEGCPQITQMICSSLKT